MTAFAAVVHKHDEPPAIAAVAQAIGSVTGERPSILVLGRCAMAVAPLRRDDPAAPVVSGISGVAVAGQIVLEEHRHFAATLGETAGTSSAAALVGAAYGRWHDRCAEHLSGEYAFALWEPREQALVCARDGLGIRLLYVAESAAAIVVTNVLSAALRHPSMADDLDEVALIAFLAHGGAADETRTCYRNVKVLPPGHTLTVRVRPHPSTTLRRHWRFPLADGTRRSRKTILEEYRSTLSEAVRDRLDAGGTTIFLSGGIDSTTMAAAATEVAVPGTLHGLTTRYPRYVEDLELPFTRAAAGHLALPLTVMDADTHQPWYEDPTDPPLASPLDEPMLADWRAALATAAGHGTVALYGEDGDALLRPPGWQGLRGAGSVAAIGLAAARYALAERRRPYIGLRWRERIGLAPPRRREPPSWLAATARTLLDARTESQVLGQRPEPLPPHPTRPEAQTLLTSTNISRFLAAMIAPEVTHRPVELRLPLLDSRLIRLVVSVPAIPWCQHKTLPRQAYRGRLPGPVLKRPKTPLDGFNEAFVAAWRTENGGRLTTPGAPLDEWIDVREWTRTLQSGEPAAVMAAWRVTALDSWLATRSRTVKDAACTR